MSAAAIWPWATTIGGWLFAAAGLFLAYRALFGDSGRGKCRCPKCWYDMTGLDARRKERGTDVYTCPECGRAIRGARALRRTRRRWRLVLVAAPVLSLAYASLVAERMSKVGAVGGVPGVVLAVASSWLDPSAVSSSATFPPWFPPTQGGAATAKTLHEAWTDELSRRITERQLNVLERWVLYAPPVVRNTWLSPTDGPTAGINSDGWLSDGLMGSHVPHRLTSWLWRSVLKRNIKMNPEWPAEIPLAFQVGYPAWLSGAKVSARDPATDTRVLWDRASAHSIHWIELDTHGKVGERVVLEVEALPRGTWNSAVRPFKWKFALARIKHARLDEVVAPVDLPSLADALAAGVTIDRTVYRGNPETLVFDPAAALKALPEDVGLGISIEFVCRGEMVCTGLLAARNSLSRLYLISDVREWRKEHPGAPFTIRIRTHPLMVMRELGCTRYWRGEANIALLPNREVRVVEPPAATKEAAP